MKTTEELERDAYIQGDAVLYDKVAELEAIDINELKDHAFNMGYESGKKEASDAELQQEIEALKAQVKSLKDCRNEIIMEFEKLTTFLGSDESKLKSNRDYVKSRSIRKLIKFGAFK